MSGQPSVEQPAAYSSRAACSSHFCKFGKMNYQNSSLEIPGINKIQWKFVFNYAFFPPRQQTISCATARCRIVSAAFVLQQMCLAAKSLSHTHTAPPSNISPPTGATRFSPSRCHNVKRSTGWDLRRPLASIQTSPDAAFVTSGAADLKAGSRQIPRCGTCLALRWLHPPLMQPLDGQR